MAIAGYIGAVIVGAVIAKHATTSTEPTANEARALFSQLERTFPSASLGDERWYLLAITALTGAGQTNHAATLYTYLVNKPAYSTSESRQNLMRRLREALVKSVSIYGVCKPLEAIIQIDRVEREEDKDYSFSREHWQSGPESCARGDAWLDRIYQGNRAGTVKVLDAHKDFAWISSNITYGLYLSDHSILDGVETEIVVLAGIMIQNLPRQTGWHLRGIRRLDVTVEEVEGIWECIKLVANFAGVDVGKVPRVGEVEHEV